MKTLKSNLKPNLLGVFALIAAFGLVLGMSAFTTGEVKRDSYTFYYDGPVPASISDVENEDNWTHAPIEETCNDLNVTACTIEIDDAFVDNSNPSAPVLLPSAELKAAASPSSAYVTGSDDPTMNFTNRQ